MTDRVLLDTHTLLWWAADAKTLIRNVKRLIEDDRTTIYVSAASAWEIATKVRLGKLKWDSAESVESYCIGQGFDLLPVTFADKARPAGLNDFRISPPPLQSGLGHGRRSTVIRSIACSPLRARTAGCRSRPTTRRSESSGKNRLVTGRQRTRRGGG